MYICVSVRIVLIEFMFKFTGMCLLILNHEEEDFRRQSLESFFFSSSGSLGANWNDPEEY